MADRLHRYAVRVVWTGNEGRGTANHAGYARSHEIEALGKPAIAGSSDPAFRGDATRWNPEELLVGSIAACHKLWYLALCAQAGVVVTAYADDALGEMIEEAGGAGRFASVTLRPVVTIAAGCDAERARSLHAAARAHCFIARSVAFPIRHEPTIVVEPRGQVPRGDAAET